MLELLIAAITFAIGAAITTAIVLRLQGERERIVEGASAEAKKILEAAGLTESDLKLMNAKIPKMAEVNWELFEERIYAILESGQEPNIADVLRNCERDKWMPIKIGSEPFYVNTDTHELMMESNSEIVPCPHPHKQGPTRDDDFEWACVWCDYEEPKKVPNPFARNRLMRHYDAGPSSDKYLRYLHERAREALKGGDAFVLPEGYQIEYVTVDQDNTIEPVIFKTGRTERIHR